MGHNQVTYIQAKEIKELSLQFLTSGILKVTVAQQDTLLLVHPFLNALAAVTNESFFVCSALL